MNKTYMQTKDILHRISRNNNKRVDDGYGSHSMDRRKAQAGVIESDVATSLAAQMATVTLLLKIIALNNNSGTTSSTTMINTLNQVAALSCVQRGETHLYDMCPYNLQFVCYVQNNSYSKTYNWGWRSHPNLRWGGNQQHIDQGHAP